MVRSCRAPEVLSFIIRRFEQNATVMQLTAKIEDMS